jgi:hypothetical protein
MQEERMNSHEQIVEFLLKPENLPVALEVTQQVQNLRRHTHETLWKEVQTALTDRLAASQLSGRWIITSQNNFDVAYKCIEIKLRSVPASSKVNYLEACLEQGTPAENYQLYYGLVWALEEGSVPPGTAFRTLLEKSKSLGVSDDNRNSWWTMKCFLNVFPRSDEFLMKYNPVFIEELAEQVWGYFERVEPDLYQLNQELFQGK